MKPLGLSPLLFAIAATATAADNLRVIVHTDVKPGVYGRVELGAAPPPPLVYERPILVSKPGPGVAQQPAVYLHVPPGHAKNWAKHCHKYHACSRPVYFVFSDEYKPKDKKNKR